MSDPQKAGISQPEPAAPSTHTLSTQTIHADDPLNSSTDVAPPLHPSTTFRYPSSPTALTPIDALPTPPYPPGGPAPPDSHVYSRLSAPNTSRLELILTRILHGPALTYTSGLAAFHALLIWLHPRVVAIGAGYHGCHGVLHIYQKLTHCKVVDLFDEAAWDAAALGQGDVVHLETPVNPTGRAFDIAAYARKAHERGARLTVDATFAPPPLQEPLALGADFVMHSGTKYFGGHSDMLCGVVAVRREREGWERDYWGLVGERVFLGAVMGSLEGWLGVRSLRTLELRVRAQSKGCEALVGWLVACLDGGVGSEEERGVVAKVVGGVEHASLQTEDMGWLREQMPQGFGPVFALSMKSGELAKRLPSKLQLFHHATSLGGVESLIEWRRMSDNTVEDTLLRVSVGIEGWEDLRDDLVQGFQALAKEYK